jgi:hypothetical protein
MSVSLRANDYIEVSGTDLHIACFSVEQPDRVFGVYKAWEAILMPPAHATILCSDQLAVLKLYKAKII